MILAVDIGNSNIVVGVFDGDLLISEFRLKTDSEKTADEYGAILEQMLGKITAKKPTWQSCGVCSVVPSLTSELVHAVERIVGVSCTTIGPGVKTGIQLKVHEPASVGADRVVNALAARELFGAPSVVVDFGTATSFDVVSPDGAFIGGAIAPGVHTALGGLVSRTAKLPQIEITWPAHAIGKNTVSAMQVGVVKGYLYLVDGLLSEIEQELGVKPYVVATGGVGKLFAEHSSKIQSYDPHLTLKGIRHVLLSNSTN